MERRKFLELAVGFGVALSTDPIKVTQAFAQEARNPALATLEDYQGYVEAEKADFTENVVSQVDLFTNYFPVTRERQLADFNLYYPLYRAAEIEYGVPWQLLWVMHIQETQVSTHPNPGASGYEAAMQRSPRLYPLEQTLQAAENWEFLKALPQRYNQGVAPFRNDYREILWAANHVVKKGHNIYPGYSFEEGILKVVRSNYSAEVYGNQRVNQFLKIRPFFDPFKRSL